MMPAMFSLTVFSSVSFCFSAQGAQFNPRITVNLSHKKTATWRGLRLNALTWKVASSQHCSQYGTLKKKTDFHVGKRSRVNILLQLTRLNKNVLDLVHSKRSTKQISYIKNKWKKLSHGQNKLLFTSLHGPDMGNLLTGCGPQPMVWELLNGKSILIQWTHADSHCYRFQWHYKDCMLPLVALFTNQ